MRRAFWLCACVAFGIFFWSALDASAVTHEPFDFFDRHTLFGLSAWMCAVFSVRCYEISKG